MGKKYGIKIEKKRINELSDDFQYETFENHNKENKECKSNENQLYEMN